MTAERDKMRGICRSKRFTEPAQKYVERNAASHRTLSDDELNDLARQAIAAGVVSFETLDNVRVPVPALLDPDDRETIESYNDCRASVEILQRAVKLLTRDLVGLKLEAMKLLVKAAQPRREALARNVGNALLQLLVAAREEKQLATELSAQEPALPGMMTPPMFESTILSDPRLIGWLDAAVAAGVVETNHRAEVAALGFRSADNEEECAASAVSA